MLKSAHDCAEGGLAVALAECGFKRDKSVLGCEINMPFKYPAHIECFGESHGRIIVTTDVSNAERLVAICKQRNQKFIKLGVVKGNNLILNDKIKVNLKELRELYDGALQM